MHTGGMPSTAGPEGESDLPCACVVVLPLLVHCPGAPPPPLCLQDMWQYKGALPERIFIGCGTAEYSATRDHER